MKIVVMDHHPIEDGRISRHIRFLLDRGFDVYNIHYNLFDVTSRSGSFSRFGEKGYWLDICSKRKGKTKSLLFLIDLLSKKQAKVVASILGDMHLDESKTIILHVHDPFLLPLACKLIKYKFDNAKIVYDRHEVYENSSKDYGINLPRHYENVGRKNVSGVIAVSDHHKSSINRLFAKSDIITVPNYPLIKEYNLAYIDDKINSFGSNSEINLVYIGGLSPFDNRDIDLLIQIALTVLENTDNTNFIIGGRWESQNMRERFAYYSRKYPGRFNFLGSLTREKTIEITQKSHIGFLLHKTDDRSWVRSSPNKIFEYLACGVIPVIRANIDCLNEIDEFSLVIPRSAGEDKIKADVLELLSDYQKIKKLMSQSRLCANKFSWESAASRYVDLYNRLAEQNI